MKRITVFCGSSMGVKAAYRNSAVELARAMAERGIELVYGGAKVGLMGVVADAMLEAGGKVTGVLPRFLQAKELAHDALTELVLVDSMHERKMVMNEKCDGVIALPGGFGTLEELFEMLTWGQLGLHTKPIGLLNAAGFFDELQHFITRMVTEGFLKELHAGMLLMDSSPGKLLQKMEQFQPPETLKWLTPPTS